MLADQSCLPLPTSPDSFPRHFPHSTPRGWHVLDYCLLASYLLPSPLDAETPHQVGPKPKRRRLNFACDNCRNKKIRCDEQKPACLACLAAAIECVTTDKRRLVRRTAVSGSGSAISHSQSRADDASDTSDAISSVAAPLPVPNPVLPLVSDRLRRPSKVSNRTSLLAAPEPSEAVSSSASASASTSASGPHPPAEARSTRTRPQDAHSSGRFAGRLPIVPRIAGSNTLEVLTGWLDLAFHRLNIACINTSASASASALYAVPAISLSVARVPSLPRCQDVAASYFSTINRIYRILDPVLVQRIFGRLTELGPAQFVQDGQLPQLLIAYLVLVLGSGEAHGGCDADAPAEDLATTYLTFCETMLGHVLGWASVEAVQIVLLMSLALKARDKLASAWPLTGLCASMAQSMGLHRNKMFGRRLPDPEAAGDEAELTRRRVWWSIYAYEKLFAFELGRPSTIKDTECDQPEPDGSQTSDLHSIVIGLGRALSQISKTSIKARNQEEMAHDGGLENAIRDKVKTTGETVLFLMHWQVDPCRVSTLHGTSTADQVLYQGRPTPRGAETAVGSPLRSVRVSSRQLCLDAVPQRVSLPSLRSPSADHLMMTRARNLVSS